MCCLSVTFQLFCFFNKTVKHLCRGMIHIFISVTCEVINDDLFIVYSIFIWSIYMRQIPESFLRYMVTRKVTFEFSNIIHKRQTIIFTGMYIIYTFLHEQKHTDMERHRIIKNQSSTYKPNQRGHNTRSILRKKHWRSLRCSTILRMRWSRCLQCCKRIFISDEIQSVLAQTRFKIH